jgi:L-iditol 2-dehydrogenase
MTAVGVCGSDLHWFDEGAIGDVRLTRPLVLGHELAGVTEEGRPVAVDPLVGCLECPPCLGGDPNLCLAVRFAGSVPVDGGLREWMAWPSRCLVPLPAGFSASDGAMLEPLGIVLHALDLAHLRPGVSVGVFGCGPIGLLALQVARAGGAWPLYATERTDRPHRVEAARALGATVFAADGGEARRLVDAAGGRGVDIALEAAGQAEAIDAAVESARAGGRVVIVGISSDPRTSFDASASRRKGLTILVSRRARHIYPRAIRLVQSGLVDVRQPVTHRFPLEDAPAAFALALRREGVKVMIHPGPE